MEAVTQSVVVNFRDSWVIAILWRHKGDDESRYIRLQTIVEKYDFTEGFVGFRMLHICLMRRENCRLVAI